MRQKKRHDDDADANGMLPNKTTHALQLDFADFMRRAVDWEKLSVTPVSLSAALQDLSTSTHSRPRCVDISPESYGEIVVENSAPCLFRSSPVATALPRDDNNGPLGTAVFTCPVHIKAQEPLSFTGVWFASRVVVSGAAHVFFHHCLFGAAPSVGVCTGLPLSQQPPFANVDVGSSSTCTFSECEFDYVCGSVNGAGSDEVPALTARDQASLEIYNTGFAGAHMPATVLAVCDTASVVAEHVTVEEARAHSLVISGKGRATVQHSVFGRSGRGVWVRDTGSLCLRATTLEPARDGRSSLALTHRATCDAGESEFIGPLTSSVVLVPSLSLVKAKRTGTTAAAAAESSASVSSISPVSQAIITARDQSRLVLTDCDLYWDSAASTENNSKNGNNHNLNNGYKNIDYNEADAESLPRAHNRPRRGSELAISGFYHIVLCSRSEATVTRCRLRFPRARGPAVGLLLWQAPRAGGISLYASGNIIVFDAFASNGKYNDNGAAWGLLLPSESNVDICEDSENKIRAKKVGEPAHCPDGEKAWGQLRQIAAMWAGENHFIRSDVTPVRDPTRMCAVCDLDSLATGRLQPSPLRSTAPHSSQLLNPTPSMLQRASFDEFSSVSLATNEYSDGRNSTVAIEDNRTSLTSFGETNKKKEKGHNVSEQMFGECDAERRSACLANTRFERPLGKPPANTAPPLPPDTQHQKPKQKKCEHRYQRERSVTKQRMPSSSSQVRPSLSKRESQWVDRRRFIAAAQDTQPENSQDQIDLDRQPLVKRDSTVASAGGLITRTRKGSETPATRQSSIKSRTKATKRKATAPANVPRSQSMKRAAGNAANAVKSRRSGLPSSTDYANVMHHTRNQQQQQREGQSELFSRHEFSTPQRSDCGSTSHRDASRSALHAPKWRSGSSGGSSRARDSISTSSNRGHRSKDGGDALAREVWPWDVEALRALLRKKLGLYPTLEAFERAFQCGDENNEGGSGYRSKAKSALPPKYVKVDPLLKHAQEQVPFTSCALRALAQQFFAMFSSPSSSASPSRSLSSASERLCDDHIDCRETSQMFGELMTGMQHDQRRCERLLGEEMEKRMCLIYTEASRRAKRNAGHKELSMRASLTEQRDNVCATEDGAGSRRRPSLHPPIPEERLKQQISRSNCTDFNLEEVHEKKKK